jgi:hypothetical protein
VKKRGKKTIWEKRGDRMIDAKYSKTRASTGKIFQRGVFINGEQMPRVVARDFESKIAQSQ